MSLPNAGKVNMKTPQNSGGLPKIGAMGSGSVLPGSASQNIKGPLKKNPAPGKAHGPDKSGTKIKTNIQTGNPASRTRGK